MFKRQDGRCKQNHKTRITNKFGEKSMGQVPVELRLVYYVLLKRRDFYKDKEIRDYIAALIVNGVIDSNDDLPRYVRKQYWEWIRED